MDDHPHIALQLSRAAFGLALVLVVGSAMPRVSEGAHAPDLLGAALAAMPGADSLSYMPDAMIDTTLSLEQNIAQEYWAVIGAYASALAGVHRAQMQGYAAMGDSMAQGASDVAAAYAAAAQWYARADAHAARRLEGAP
jgi:hypothetical protein